jgi:hypothetical protein
MVSTLDIQGGGACALRLSLAQTQRVSAIRRLHCSMPPPLGDGVGEGGAETGARATKRLGAGAKRASVTYVGELPRAGLDADVLGDARRGALGGGDVARARVAVDEGGLAPGDQGYTKESLREALRRPS